MTTTHPMSDEEVRAEFLRQRTTSLPRKTSGTKKTVAQVLEQLEALDGVRMASDAAPVATCDELTTSALEDLFANRTCALRIPRFATTPTCEELAPWITRGPLRTWGGTDTSYGAGIPLNAFSWSLELTEAYFREALPAMRAVRRACAGSMTPIDKLRLELDELWLSGANVSRDNPFRRKMLAGLARVMRPDGLLEGIAQTEGLVHTDSSHLITEQQGLFSANTYLEVPSRGGELNVFPLAMKQPEHLESLVRVIGFLLQHAFDDAHRDRVQRQLHALLPAPLTIKPEVGDLVILNTGRLHAVRGFAKGTRVTLQSFVRHRDGEPLQLFS